MPLLMMLDASLRTVSSEHMHKATSAGLACLPMPDQCQSPGPVSDWHQWVTVDSRISHVEMSRMDLQGTQDWIR
jgi:hypothetical protein